jgi:tetratricopeptide (TPR) repeat protein
MKRTILTLIAAVFTVATYAQSANFDKGMTQGIELMNAAKSPDEFTNTANYFERVAQTEKNQWLPYYYAAYSNLISGVIGPDNSKKDAIYEKSLDLLSKASELNPNNSEVETLIGYTSLMKVYVDPMTRYPSIGEAMAKLEKAKKLDPNNPRPLFVQAQNAFYTPEAYGGGKKVALPQLKAAQEKFESFKPANAFAPTWGKERCKLLIEEAGK